MEYRLNKIDTDIRKRMQEQIKSDKIHENKKVSIKKDLKEDENKNKGENKKNTKNQEDKRFYTIDGVKYEENVMEIEVQKEQVLDEENYRGIKLDVKK
ncbi:hypothetical protein [Clostridium sp. C2-6-12]|uniref:hypothetical protein n=1 Tax=Clostridium sp. C2-6-12 TaxID=2698832 RepID=UPI001368A6C2|nr:hypothetical protein [Clostridium sp. C2-6-12]